ncbi:MAG: peptide deformylase, partial [Sphingomonadales bacterium]
IQSMTVQKIRLMGNPVLMSPAQPVDDPRAPEIASVIADMRDSMEAAGGIGIAAPQIGVGKRVVMFHVPTEDDGFADSTDPDHRADLMTRGLTVLINPEIEILTDAGSNEVKDGWEGCLSVPGMRGLVPRHQHIRYRGLTPEGHRIEREAHGFHAVVVQHECDHLDGILYPMRMTDLGSLHYVSETDAIVEAAEKEPA